jgi:DNA-directed RNA polymerase specialized sigma24 family protein
MNDDKDLRELVTRLNQLVEVLVRLKLEEVRGERSQKEMILFLGTMGCSPGDIANLLSIKETNVYPILSRARQTNKRS